ncbi:MAG TPA: hypothetical protein VGS80_14590, partial [Ktedonobacterales bacterium]|nr:hypothetical protein [Ktedonobacterales bacterium]
RSVYLPQYGVNYSVPAGATDDQIDQLVKRDAARLHSASVSFGRERSDAAIRNATAPEIQPGGNVVEGTPVTRGITPRGKPGLVLERGASARRDEAAAERAATRAEATREIRGNIRTNTKPTGLLDRITRAIDLAGNRLVTATGSPVLPFPFGMMAPNLGLSALEAEKRRQIAQLPLAQQVEAQTRGSVLDAAAPGFAQDLSDAPGFVPHAAQTLAESLTPTNIALGALTGAASSALQDISPAAARAAGLVGTGAFSAMGAAGAWKAAHNMPLYRHDRPGYFGDIAGNAAFGVLPWLHARGGRPEVPGAEVPGGEAPGGEAPRQPAPDTDTGTGPEADGNTGPDSSQHRRPPGTGRQRQTRPTGENGAGAGASGPGTGRGPEAGTGTNGRGPEAGTGTSGTGPGAGAGAGAGTGQRPVGYTDPVIDPRDINSSSTIQHLKAIVRKLQGAGHPDRAGAYGLDETGRAWLQEFTKRVNALHERMRTTERGRLTTGEIPREYARMKAMERQLDRYLAEHRTAPHPSEGSNGQAPGAERPGENGARATGTRGATGTAERPRATAAPDAEQGPPRPEPHTAQATPEPPRPQEPPTAEPPRPEPPVEPSSSNAEEAEAERVRQAMEAVRARMNAAGYDLVESDSRGYHLFRSRSDPNVGVFWNLGGRQKTTRFTAARKLFNMKTGRPVHPEDAEEEQQDRSSGHIAGKGDTAFTHSQRPVAFHYAVVPAEDLVTSHRPAGGWD